MKKLMFATALVASAAAFATNGTMLNATSFEGYTADTAVIGIGGGDVSETGASANYFCYEGDQDGSMVRAYGGDNLSAPGIRPYYFQGVTPNANYLELSTEGGILWRSIDPIRSYTVDNTTTYSNGAPVAVAAAGTYLDTLVQFTPTEDGGAPELDAADKLAIWLNVDGNSVTNLQVKANLYDFGESPTPTPTTFTLVAAEGTKTIVPGQWYRLTVKAIPNVTLTDENGVIPAFEIYVDGVQMCATTAQFTTAMVEVFTGMNALSEYMAAAIAANKIFPSLAEMGNQGDTPTLQGVGFKGSGALDDLVWTTEDPFANSSGGAEWIAAVTNVFVGADLSSAQTAQITSWATDNNITVAAGSEEIAAAAYLLNLTTLPAAIPELTITSIEEGADAWTLTVEASVGDSALGLPATINGTVKLTQAATLAGLATATPTTVQMTIANGAGTVTVAKDAATAKFMKVGIGIATPAQE